MRIPNERHLAVDLRVHDLLRDFRLEDVWQLPEVTGSRDDFELVIERIRSGSPMSSGNLASRFVWGVRQLLGKVFDLGDVAHATDGRADGLPIPGAEETSIVPRLPADLRGTADDLRFTDLPFVPVYRTATEFAAEISNRTVHGVLHLSWIPVGGERYEGRMAVYVKPRGWFGEAYMAFIKPFRYLIVYPALEKQMAREWAELTAAR
ncbi:hypothetical protein HNR19_004211 [Nocardioides thalensis]|uniref:DUF2867 domain-containing protein n=1 Tax=Nocardioides thalensis TaxID=1914755 RepID=A0A853CBE5_9ACTN|nr:DUF2867 domain-containing protein [Nocardioides thalensis]NYJ03513.1 hypothetical protein [Nocardioides thalensis]